MQWKLNEWSYSRETKKEKIKNLYRKQVWLKILYFPKKYIFINKKICNWKIIYNWVGREKRIVWCVFCHCHRRIEAAAVATAATTARKSVALAGAPLLPVHIHIPIPSIPISSTVYNFQHIDFQPNRMTQEKQNGRKKI